MSRKLILDTHILLWYIEGIKLSPNQVRIIEESRKRNDLYISKISFWEISMLLSKKRINLTVDLDRWMKNIYSLGGINYLDLSTQILIESNSLPGFEIKDPADRMLIASARNIQASLMTEDREILNYAAEGYVSAVEEVVVK